MHLKLQEAATKADFDRIMEAQREMELLIEKHSKLKAIDLDSIYLLDENKENNDLLLPIFPPVFTIATLKGVEDGKITLKIDLAHIPTTTFGDCCTINLKGAWLL